MRSERSSHVRSLGRFLERMLNRLPGPPDDDAPADPLLADLDRLPPRERDARRRAWLAQLRRGRGDGNG